VNAGAQQVNTRIVATEGSSSLRVAVADACARLLNGEVVALPTETVYGLAADARRADAVLKIFEVKERPLFDPLIVHLPRDDWLERVADVPVESVALVRTLIARFWPGPLTLVLPRRVLLPEVVTSGLDTVAVRMSAHPVFRAIIQQFDKPLAAPSANRFGRISPTTAAHVNQELGGRIPLIVDGGATQHGLESTIIAVENERMRVLRSGPVTREDLAEFGNVEDNRSDEKVRAPGQLKSHYAPRTVIKVTRTDTLREAIAQAGSLRHIGLLAWSRVPKPNPFDMVEVLSASGDLREAAATLFAKMRRLDEAGLELIIAEAVPTHGLGVAIMDRLRKAAAHYVD
jgi:L-threonylcarbamoyladenylate synthase